MGKFTSYQVDLTHLVLEPKTSSSASGSVIEISLGPAIRENYQ